MTKNIAIVGTGINGLLAAFLIRDQHPDISIDMYDSEAHPVGNSRHKGVTHGSRDARHITGSESIGFESSIHPQALRNTPNHDTPGWLLKKEDDLSENEQIWRAAFEATYEGSGSLNKIDFEHAALNYQGLTAWHKLADKYPFIRKHIICNDGVEVYFENKENFDDDVVMETEFCSRYYPNGAVQKAGNNELGGLYSEKLIVPGMSIRVKSLAENILTILEADDNVTFHWSTPVVSPAELHASTIVWTNGVTHAQPSEHDEYNIQGIIGCWISIKNKGYTKPFKIATPAPSAYINFTPDGDTLHISGGFGWLGEYADVERHSELAQPIAEHFIQQVNKYLGTTLNAKDVDYCVRPSTPTGQPILKTKVVNGVKHIFISGSAKSGTTHAPILSEFVITEMVK